MEEGKKDALTKVQLLQSQISEYQQKQMKNRQLNESIIVSYRQNESFKEQFNIKEVQNLKSGHQEQIRRMKLKNKEEKKKFQEEVDWLKGQNQNLKIQIDRIKLESEKNVAQVVKNWEQKLLSKQEELDAIYSHRISLLSEKLRQAEDFCRLYKDQLQMGLGNTLKASIQFGKSKQPSKQMTKATENVNRTIFKAKQSNTTPSSLTLRINKVLSEMNPNSNKIDQKIRDLKSNYM